MDKTNLRHVVALGLTPLAIKAGRVLSRSPIMFERFLVLAQKYIDWHDQVVVCRSEYGAYFPCRLGDQIQRKIAYFGVWEPQITCYVRQALREGDVFVDVGANIGYYTLLASVLVGNTGKVIAIEASPRIYDMLKANIERNSAGNVRAVNVAAVDQSGRVSVYAGPKSNIGSTSTIRRDGNTLETEVNAEPLQVILTREEMRRARLIKIDVEGAEAPILRSFLENQKLYNPQCELLVEIARENSSLIDEMRKSGFWAYQIENVYSDRAYVRRSMKRPTRLRSPLDAQCDVIFSRVDAEVL